MILSSYTAYDNFEKKTVHFQLFSCTLGIDLNSVDEDLELKRLRNWGFDPPPFIIVSHASIILNHFFCRCQLC